MKTSEALIRIINILIASVFLTPLILGPFGLNFSEYPKAVFFRILIEIIFIFYLFLVLLNPDYLPKKSILLFSVVAFDTILIIASIFGINFYASFFGEMQRGEGIILHLHLLAFFIVLIGLFRKKEDWLSLFKITVILSGISGIAAILQQFHVFSFYDAEPIRLSGTLSNPDLFGSYMALSIFLAIFLFISEKNSRFKILWASFAVLDFYTLVFSETRASWIGFMFGVISVYILNYKNFNFKTRVYSLLIILFICALLFLAPFIIENNHLEHSNFGSRIISIYNISISDRLNVWGIAYNAFKNRPILGWGFESFSYVSDKYLKIGYENGIYYDRPHNKIIEILIYGGILGIISYLAIFFILFYLIFKYARKWDGYNNKSGVLFASVIFAFFVTGFVQNIFSFDHIGTYILFFLAAGFVNNSFSDLPEADIESDDKKISFGKVIVISAVSIFILFFAYKINIEPTIAAMNFPKYLRYESYDAATAIDGYQKAIEMNTFYKNDFVLAFMDRLIFILENSYGHNDGTKAVEYSLKMKPILEKDLNEKNERPDGIYEFLIRTDEWAYIIKKDKKYLDDMNSDINNAMQFNPNMPDFWQLKGEMEILQNNYDNGEKYINKSCEMSDTCASNKSLLYQIMGSAYFKAGNYEMAIKNFQQTLDMDYAARKNGFPSTIQNPGPFIDSVASMYYTYFKDSSDAKKVYEIGIEAYPEYKDYFEQRLNMINTGN